MLLLWVVNVKNLNLGMFETNIQFDIHHQVHVDIDDTFWKLKLFSKPVPCCFYSPQIRNRTALFVQTHLFCVPRRAVKLLSKLNVRKPEHTKYTISLVCFPVYLVVCFPRQQCPWTQHDDRIHHTTVHLKTNDFAILGASGFMTIESALC